MYNILEYGAVGDGAANDGPAIQAAVDACHRAGGGVVLFPGGRVYRSGYVILLSNVEVHLEMGAVWKASDRIEDYYPLRNNGQITAHESGLPSFLNSEYAGKPFHAFIYALEQENICISGQGTIDGNESIFYGDDSGYHIEGTYYPRVPLLLLEAVTHLTIRGVTLTGCAFWTVHLVGCEDVLIDGIRLLNNLKMANSDGIDPDHCRNVRITNCHIECGDDAIVLKNSGDYKKYGSCENIVISNCTLVSTSAAIKFGTEGESDFRNILVTNCCISKSNRGISIQIRDCGSVENVIFSNIRIETRRFSYEWWGRAEAICLTALDRKPGVKAGKIRNVRFQNITCEGENGIFILGSPDNPIEDVTFDNVSLVLDRTSKWEIEGYDKRPCQGDGNIRTKISGIYVDEADHITFCNVKITKRDGILPFFKEDVTLLNVSDIKMEM